VVEMLGRDKRSAPHKKKDSVSLLRGKPDFPDFWPLKRDTLLLISLHLLSCCIEERGC